MEEPIPQSYKVQWINTTLRYLKDDNQLIMVYPDMPMQHVDYLHKLIWQRKNEVGLGFKSMYAPVWQAMRIFSSKYQFKVSVKKSVDGRTGHLIIQKVPKDEQGQHKQENEEPTQQDNLEIAKQDNPGLTKAPDESSDSEDSTTESSQPESPIHHPLGAESKKPTKTKKKKSKTEKFLIDKRKIVESISPVLLKKALRNILTFLLKEEEASIIFSDLAPVEARFLENFKGIYKKRLSFEDMLSPACNDLLGKMSEFFKEFDKKCKLEVYAAKYNVNTKKREVTFMKVPRYTRTTANQSEQFVTPEVKRENIKSVSPFRNNNEKNPKPILTQSIVNSNLKITVSNDNSTKRDAIESREIKEVNLSKTTKNEANTENKESKPSFQEVSINDAEKLEKLSMNAEQRNGKLSMNFDNKDNKLRDTIEISDNKVVVLNPELLKREIEKIAIPKDTTKSGMPEKKADNLTVTSTNRIKEGSLCARKEKLFQDMSTPLESDKAMRMMRLMGWEGGALGLRGEGIVEPIIPALDIVPGKGLGHVVEKKPAKPEKHSKVKENQKNSRVGTRIDFLNTILDLLKKDMAISAVSYSAQFNQRDKTCCDYIIRSLNKNQKISLTDVENVILAKIKRVMDREPTLSLNLEISSDLREITITKTLKTEYARSSTNKPQTVNKTPDWREPKHESTKETKINVKMTKNVFKFYICTEILNFLKSDVKEKWVDFEAVFSEKYQDILDMICFCVNKRTMVPYKMLRELFWEIFKVPYTCFLDVQYATKPTRSFLLRKFYPRKPSVNNEVLKSIINKYTNTVIPETDNLSHPVDKEIVKSNTNNEDTEVDLIKNKVTASTKEYLKNINEIREPDTAVTFNSVVDSRGINERTQKIYVRNAYDDILKLRNNKVTTCEDFKDKPSTTLKMFPLYVKDTNIANNDDLRRIDMDLMQDTINSLTSNAKHLEDDNSKSVNNSLVRNDFHIYDNLTNNESSNFVCNVLDTPCEMTDNMRQWYDHSEKFLMCYDPVKNTSLEKKIDSNNNKKRIVDVELDENIREKEINIDIKTNDNIDIVKNGSKVGNDDAKLIEIDKMKNCEINCIIDSEMFSYNVHKNSQLGLKQVEENDSVFKYCSYINDNTYETEAKELVVNEKRSDLDTLPEKQNGSVDLKLVNLLEQCGDMEVIEVETLQTHEQESHNKNESHTEIDKNQRDYDNNLVVIKEFCINESKIISPREDIYSKLEVRKIETDCGINLSKRQYETTRLNNSTEEGESKYIFEIISKNDIGDLGLKNYQRTIDLVESEKTGETNSKFEDSQIKQDLKENSIFKTEHRIEKPEDSLKINRDNTKLDIDNCFNHINENQMLDLSNIKTDKNCYDVLLIEAYIVEIDEIRNKIQKAIENLDFDNISLPMLKFHGTLEAGLVYSCHNKESSLWLRNLLSDYNVKDYKSAIDNYTLKINVACVNGKAKTILKLLEAYNRGLKCEKWKIIYENCHNQSLIIGIEIDRGSLDYVCDNNFSLGIGYDIAQFSIGC